MKAGWRLVPLSEVAAVGAGNPAPQDKADFQGGAFPFIRTSDVGQIRFGEISTSADMVNEKCAKKLRLVPKGTVLFPKSGASTFLNHRVITTVDAYVSSHLATITAKPKLLDSRFLLYALSRVRAQELLPENSYPSLNLSLLNSATIPLPPLDEQKRIVAVLDEAFEGLSRARANAEANLADARELFATFVAANFLSNSIQGAAPATLGEVCTIQSGAGFPEKYQGKSDGEHPFYKVSDMNLPGNEWALAAANNYISEDVRKTLRAAVFPTGAIVFPKVGGAIATNKKRIVAAAGCVDNNVMGLIPDEGRVESKYLHEWLRAFNIYDFSNKANPPSITQGTVSAWPINLPSRKEQIRIVAAAEALRNHTQGLELTYAECLSDLDALRKALLQKAFSGELT